LTASRTQHGAKPADSALSIHRSQEADIGSDGSSSLLDDQDIDDGRRNNRQSLDDEAPAPAAEGGEPAQGPRTFVPQNTSLMFIAVHIIRHTDMLMCRFPVRDS
jgi:hypothetical protein